MTDNLYSTEAEDKRRQFNRIINGIDMVLMNNIPQVDPSIWDNWDGKSPISQDCETEEDGLDDGLQWYMCKTHEKLTLDEYSCEDYEGETEVYQWFAINSNDADFLKDHNQYITYSDVLDTYFLAICHWGTAWDYTQMVDDFEDLYLPLLSDIKLPKENK